MDTYPKKLILLLLLSLTFTNAFPQPKTFQNKFSRFFDGPFIPVANSNFKEFYEINIQQTLDHSNPKQKFNQRIYIGFHDFNAPTLIITDGYACDYVSRSDYSNELAKELKANIVVVEHRFFGKSVPDSLDWSYLTLKQAAGDYHVIKLLLNKVLNGKWLSSGISKGGQAALAYKLFYPNDVSAVIAYGAAIKNRPMVFTDTILSNLSQTPCGKKIQALQSYSFRHKNGLVPLFSQFTSERKYHFTPMDNETVLDYVLLELPFSYWQNGHSCEDIPDTTANPDQVLAYLVKIVPPRFFTANNRKQMEPAFYMFYHELGYYEYNTRSFTKYLQQKSYSNKRFAPLNEMIAFDNSFLKQLNAFIKSDKAECVFLIYGQNDPWALQTVAEEHIFAVPEGSHKSRISDFPVEQREEIYQKIRACIE